MNKLISLGCNCSVAYNTKLLGIRDPSPLDWVDHFPVLELLTNDYEILMNRYMNLWIHEDLTEYKEYIKVQNRFHNLFSNKTSDYIYLMESYNEFNSEFINSLVKITKDKNLYIIHSFDNELNDINKSVILLKDNDYIFDANKLKENSELCKKFLIKNY